MGTEIMNAEDKELVELAAKAAGEENVSHSLIKWDEWDPLRDSGDNRDLQVALKIAVYPTKDGEWCAWTTKFGGTIYHEDINRAVLMVAAEIGRRMGK